MEDNEFMAIIQEAMNMSEMAADEVKDQRRRTAAYEGSVIAQQMQAAAAAGSKIDQGQKMLLEDELTERAELREALRKHRGSRRWQLDLASARTTWVGMCSLRKLRLICFQGTVHTRSRGVAL
jgi:hypothetical protein